jgi:multidrug resistance efflux pump
MKPTSRALWLLGGFVFVAASFVAMFHALFNERMENESLRGQVFELTARVDKLVQENRILMIATEKAKGGSERPRTPTIAPTSEVLRLRGEVSRLQSLEREATQAQVAKMQAAQAKVPDAEAELERMTKLFDAKVVSTSEFIEAKYKLEALKAEAKGDSAEAARLRLRQAEEELSRATELHKLSLISQTEFDQAAKKVESLRTGARP